MKSFKKINIFSPFVIFVSLFVSASTLFFFASYAFCKVAPFDTASTTAKQNTPIIIIDAGHGGEDGGTVGANGVFEKDINLKIAYILRDISEACGYTTIMTRSEDILLYDRNVDFKGRKKALDLLARVKIANSYENALFLSIHMNSFPEKKYSGLQVYYSKNNDGSALLAENIQSGIKADLQKSNDRKTKPAGSNIYILERIELPAVLIECGFLSNDEECAKLSSDGYQKQLALSIFSAISKYIEEDT